MLWSESRVPTNYYYTHTGTWSGFWLLDPSGERLRNGHYSSVLVQHLLDTLF